MAADRDRAERIRLRTEEALLRGRGVVAAGGSSSSAAAYNTYTSSSSTRHLYGSSRHADPSSADSDGGRESRRISPRRPRSPTTTTSAAAIGASGSSHSLSSPSASASAQRYAAIGEAWARDAVRRDRDRERARPRSPKRGDKDRTTADDETVERRGGAAVTSTRTVRTEVREDVVRRSTVGGGDSEAAKKKKKSSGGGRSSSNSSSTSSSSSDDREFASISPRRHRSGSGDNHHHRHLHYTHTLPSPSSSSSPSVAARRAADAAALSVRVLPADKGAADRLFAEYLRIINDKDEEIHRLIVEVERAHHELRRRDEKFKEKLKDLKGSIVRLQSTADSYKAKEAALARAEAEGVELRSDVEKLRTALADCEGRLQSVFKASDKAAKQEAAARQKAAAEHETFRAEWADKLRAAQQATVAAEAQRDSLKVRNDEGERDALRWKVEAQRLQEEATEQQQALRELRRQARDMRPIAAVEVEMQQLEARHKGLIDEYEREAERSRRTNKDLSLKANELEVRLSELQHRYDDAARQAQHQKMAAQDADALIGQLRLEKQQQLEEARAESVGAQRLLQKQIDAYYADKVATEGELAVARQRAADVEGAATAQAERFAAEERRLHEHIAALKSQLSEASDGAAAATRRFQQQSQQLDAAEANAATLQEELRRAQQENRRNEDLKVQVVEGGRANEELRQRIRHHETALRDKDEAINEARNELDVCRRDARAEQTRRATEHSDLIQKIRFLEEESLQAQKKSIELANQLSLTEHKEKAGAGMIAELEEGIGRMKEAVRDRDKAIEALRADMDRMARRIEEGQAAADAAHEAVAAERHERAAIADRAARLEATVRQKEQMVEALNADVRRIEAAAAAHESELEQQLDQTRGRVQSLVKELHAAQQSAGVAKVEQSRAEARAEEAAADVQRTVIEPLGRKVEELQRALADMRREAEGREEKVREQNELLNRQADLVEKLRVEVVARDKRIGGLEDAKEAKEKDSGRREARLEEQIRELTRQLDALRDKEMQQMQDLAARRSEVVTWRERCANLESLKTIADNAVEEYKAREADMLEKIEEMHQSQQIMQTCFDKQQEQIELGKRLREQDLAARRGV